MYRVLKLTGVPPGQWEVKRENQKEIRTANDS